MKQTWKRCLAGLTAAAAAFSAFAFKAPGSPAAVAPEITAEAASSVLAFPGAVGGGKYATGGRGGTVYHVTNLNDSGAGSFRDAVSQGNRIVVFDVSGTIELKSNVVCQSNITIAGQTAPGGSGITLKNYKMGMGGTNVICRFISSRPGPYNATGSGNDAWGGAGGGDSIIDHCSLGWASDEQWGLYSKNDNYTVQYTVVGPANSWGGHDKGIHGFGIMFGRANFSWDHNLILHSVSRNFRGKITDQNAADFTNNVIYDWGYQTTYGTIGHVNYVNNTLKAGNSTVSGFHYAQVSNSDNFKLYLTGNRILNKDMSVRNDENNNWSAISYKSGKTEATTRVDSHFPITINGEDVSTTLTAESAADSYEHVITYAGNGISSTKRTAIDQQCAADVKNGTGSCSGTAAYDSSVSDLNKYSIQCGVTYTYPSAVLNKEITDNDNDGMDDEWEELRGLDPNDPSDTNGDYCGQGYTNIEYYINDLTVNAFPEGVVELSPTTASLKTVSAFERIEAEDYSAMEGVRAEDTSDVDGVQNIGFIENGDYMMYKRLDFEDGALSFTARSAGNACTMELYLDSLNGTPAAAIPFAGTGGFQNWEDVTVNIPPITGVHNLYIKFTGGEGYLMNVNWFVFGREALPQSGRLVKDLTVLDTTYISSWSLLDNIAVGSKIYGDRDFTYTALPDALIGGEEIVTPCNAKNILSGDLAKFTAASDLTVYVLLDQRVTAAPAWLSGFSKTGQTATSSNDVTFDVYASDLSAGSSMTLAANGQSASCLNYAVVCVGNTQTPTEAPTEAPTAAPTEAPTAAPTEAPTAAPTEAPTTAPTEAPTDGEPVSKLAGDADCDFDTDIMDVILINKDQLGSATLEGQGRINADVDGTEGLSFNDAVTVMKYLVDLVTELPVKKA
ncbi:MAG: carbohydrate-binding protein [Oscillospiraceae bacterium]|nr:carbohydrate-binding protein [Oscillospiraceae bacterium]